MNKYLNVLVLFRNNEDLVAPYFYFLRRNTYLPLRIVALDNGSKDRTYKRLQEYKQKQDIILRVQENVGTSKGRNIVLAEIWKQEGGYCDVLCTDSDMFIIRENSVEVMKNMDFSMVSAITHSITGRVEGNGGIWCSIYKKEVWEVVKKFDEEFYNYYDDCDLFIRALKAGFKATKCLDAHCLHVWGSTNTIGSEKDTRMEILEKDKAKMIKKWGKQYV